VNENENGVCLTACSRVLLNENGVCLTACSRVLLNENGVCLTACSRVLLGKLILPRLVMKFRAFCGTQSSLLCLQDSATCPYP